MTATQPLKKLHDKNDFIGIFRHKIIMNNIKDETDFNDPILKIFTDAYKSKSYKGVISKLYKGLMKKNPTLQSTLKKNGRGRVICLSQVEVRLICVDSSGNVPILTPGGYSDGNVILASSYHQGRRHIILEGILSVGDTISNHWHIFWDCAVIK